MYCTSNNKSNKKTNSRKWVSLYLVHVVQDVIVKSVFESVLLNDVG
jgi:hypothetical protein